MRQLLKTDVHRLADDDVGKPGEKPVPPMLSFVGRRCHVRDKCLEIRKSRMKKGLRLLDKTCS
jgi:hypothetical protein